MSNVVALRAPLTAKQQGLIAFAYGKGVVKRRAALHARRYVGLISVEECEALATIGLTDAARTYREELGLFEDFARRRVDGAILDGVRAEAPHARASRAAHRAAASLLQHYRDDFNALTHGPEELGKRLEKFCDDVLSAAFLGMAEEAARGTGGEAELILREEYALALAALSAATKELPTTQQRILVLVYQEKRTLLDLPELLGVSYSTVRRQHEAALAGLRKRMEALGVLRAPAPRDDVALGARR